MSGQRRGATTRLSAVLVAVLAAIGLATTTSAAATVAAAPLQLNLKILLVGEGSSDVTTAAWQAALNAEGVPYTLVTASGTAPDETVTLPELSSGTTGSYNGVVIADSPADYAPGTLTALDTYESAFGVRQIDGYTFPLSGGDPGLGRGTGWEDRAADGRRAGGAA